MFLLKKMYLIFGALLVLFPWPSLGCRIIEMRGMSILEKGTPQQVAVFNKLKSGEVLNDLETSLFHRAQEYAFRQMLKELKEALQNFPIQERLEFGFSGACIDSTMAFSDMTEFRLSAFTALDHAKTTYPYKLRLNPVARGGRFHPLITWLSEDAGTVPRFKYKVGGNVVSDKIRAEVQAQGGLDWLTTVKTSEMKDKLKVFLSSDEVASFSQETSNPEQVLLSMEVHEEGHLGYQGDVVTTHLDNGIETEYVAQKTFGHSNFVYRISENRIVILDHLQREVLLIDAQLSEATIAIQLRQQINKLLSKYVNGLIVKYESSLSDAEKSILEEELIELLNRTPEPGERFKEISDLVWWTTTRVRTSL